MDINELLKSAHSQGASDLHIKVGSFPILRIDGPSLLCRPQTGSARKIH